MLIYFDVCSLQRPFDDRTQLRVRLEADAVREIMAICQEGRAGIVSSVALEFEARQNPHPFRRDHTFGMLKRAVRFVGLTPDVEQRATSLNQAGLRPLDALHLACAVEAQADYFCTCDDRLLKRGRALCTGPPKVVSPLELITDLGL